MKYSILFVIMAFRRIALHILVRPARFNNKNKSITSSHFWRAVSTETDQNMTTLETVVAKLKTIAPLSLAENWDNVGVLMEPSRPKFISKILLTNDLTAAVMEEAKDKTVDLIVSYHPPIFVASKKFTQNSWKDRVVIECMENRIAIFSPHTSYDAVENGVNDWLISAFDFDKESLLPVEPMQAFVNNNSHVLEVELEPSNLANVWKTITAFVPAGSRMRKDKTCFSTHVIKTGSSEKWRLRLECSHSELMDLMKGVVTCQTVDKYSVSALSKVPQSQSKCGMGRKANLKDPISLDQAVECVKSYLGLKHVILGKVEAKKDDLINTVAVCAGSGSSVLKNVEADLLVTGEMSHHQVLDAIHAGSHVILCHHTNTERGFLKDLQKRLSKVMDKSVPVIISENDREPLEIV